MSGFLVLLGCLMLLAPARHAGAQTAAAGSGQAQTGRAAGMALHDGTLPPGTLTARVVRGNFSGNLPGVRVVLERAGLPPQQATTGADGRAQFAHLTVGTTVRVAAAVDGERLESESIVLPADSGVRVLLVAGDQFVDTTKPGEVANLPPLSDAPTLLPGSSLPVSPPPRSATAAHDAASERTPAAAPPNAAATFRMVMIALTVLAFAAVAFGQWKRGWGRRI